MQTLAAAVNELLSAPKGGRHTDGDALRLFRFACCEGRLDLAQELQRRFRFGPAQARYSPVIGNVEEPPALIGACAGGHREVAAWLVETFGFDVYDVTSRDGEALAGACAGGHLETARWIVERFGLEAADAAARNFGAFRASCAAGALETAQWLARTFRMTTTQAMAGDSDALIRACGSRSLPTVTWLFRAFGLTPSYVAAQGYRALVEAAKSGRAVVELIARKARGLHFNPEAFAYAAFEALKVAVRQGDEETLDYLEAEVSLGNGELAALVETGFAAGRDFVMQRYYARITLEAARKAAILQQSLAAAIENNRVALVEKYRYVSPLGMGAQAPVLVACRRGYFEVVQLLRLEVPSPGAGLIAAAEGGNPETVRLFLREADDAAVHAAFAAALLRDRFAAAKALHASGRVRGLPPNDRDAYVALCVQGDLPFLRWLVDVAGAREELLRDHESFVGLPAEGGLAASYRPQDSRVFAILETASSCDGIDIVEWLSASLCLNDIYRMAWEQFFQAAVRGGRVTMSEFWYRVGAQCDAKACSAMRAPRGRPSPTAKRPALPLARRQPVPSCRMTFQAQAHFVLHEIAAEGRLPIVRWLIARFGITPRDLAPALDEAVPRAARSGNLDLVRFLLTFEAMPEARRDLEMQALRAAFLSNQVAVVMWVGGRARLPEEQFPVSPGEMQGAGNLVREWFAEVYGEPLSASQFES